MERPPVSPAGDKKRGSQAGVMGLAWSSEMGQMGTGGLFGGGEEMGTE